MIWLSQNGTWKRGKRQIECFVSSLPKEEFSLEMFLWIWRPLRKLSFKILARIMLCFTS